MDRDAFDALTRLLVETPSRRRAVGALLGVGLAGAVGRVEGKGKRRKARGSAGKQRGAKKTFAAEAADCFSPGPSANLNGCNFNDAEFAGIDLSSSAMKGTKFRRADLTGADLSSSNLKNADFRQANLTCADLHSSACGGANFNNATFCQTRTCNGSVRDDDCPPDFDPDSCCDCGPTTVCDAGQCRAANVCLPPGACQYASVRDAVLDPNGPSVLRVAAGTYPGRFNTPRTMTIIGAGSGPGGTNLVPASGDQTALIGVGIGFDLTLQDLAITGNAHGGAGGGMRIFDGSTVVLTRVLIANNVGTSGGGILNDGDLTLRAGTTITDNESTIESGGGIRNIGTVTLLPGSDVSGNINGDCVNGTGGVGCP